MSERQRLFFALWPSEALRQTITPLLKLHQQCGGKGHPPANLHLTLNFLGGVEKTTRDCLEQASSEIVVPPFELILDRFGYWPRPRVMWLGCSETPSPLTELVTALDAVVEGCGLVQEHRPYQPHMTLLRKAGKAPGESPPELHWPVNEFVLAESVSTPGGVEYRVLRRWGLK
jgi:2'-5' RNA ligase